MTNLRDALFALAVVSLASCGSDVKPMAPKPDPSVNKPNYCLQAMSITDERVTVCLEKLSTCYMIYDTVRTYANTIGIKAMSSCFRVQ